MGLRLSKKHSLLKHIYDLHYGRIYLHQKCVQLKLTSHGRDNLRIGFGVGSDLYTALGQLVVRSPHTFARQQRMELFRAEGSMRDVQRSENVAAHKVTAPDVNHHQIEGVLGLEEVVFEDLPLHCLHHLTVLKQQP